MAFISFGDDSSEIDITIFPELFEKHNNILNENRFYLIKGTYDLNRNSIILNDINIKEVKLWKD